MSNKRICYDDDVVENEVVENDGFKEDLTKIKNKHKEMSIAYIKDVLSTMKSRSFHRSLNVLNGKPVEIEPLESIFNDIFYNIDKLIELLIEMSLDKKYSTSDETCYNYWLHILGKHVKD